MDDMYFLIAIGVLAIALVSWLVSVERKHSLKVKKQKNKAHLKAQVHHKHLPTINHTLPSRTTSHPPRHMDAWEMRHQRAGEERRHGAGITAERLVSDEEAPEVEQTEGLAMSAIEYVPDSVPKISQPRR